MGEIRALAAMGCTGPNQAKAFTRCGMGPCQGRFCGSTVEQIFASESAVSPQQVDRFNSRPPLKPVTLGQLACTSHQSSAADAAKRTVADRTPDGPLNVGPAQRSVNYACADLSPNVPKAHWVVRPVTASLQRPRYERR